MLGAHNLETLNSGNIRPSAPIQHGGGWVAVLDRTLRQETNLVLQSEVEPWALGYPA
jgi:hypothetical protein